MVERYAILKDGVVINVCLWDGDLHTWQPPEGCDCFPTPDEAAIGWTYDGTNWTAPVVIEAPADEPAE